MPLFLSSTLFGLHLSCEYYLEAFFCSRNVQAYVKRLSLYYYINSDEKYVYPLHLSVSQKFPSFTGCSQLKPLCSRSLNRCCAPDCLDIYTNALENRGLMSCPVLKGSSATTSSLQSSREANRFEHI